MTYPMMSQPELKNARARKLAAIDETLPRAERVKQVEAIMREFAPWITEQ